MDENDAAQTDQSKKFRSTIVLFGSDVMKSDICAQEVKVLSKDKVRGLYFKLLYKDSATPLFVPNVLDIQAICDILAAVALAIVFGATPLEAGGALEQMK